jgi:hypothetical protein
MITIAASGIPTMINSGPRNLTIVSVSFIPAPIQDLEDRAFDSGRDLILKVVELDPIPQ